ncbi:MAG TPA: hypothetical protein VIK77_02875 [Tissierellaceae bacterium]
MYIITKEECDRLISYLVGQPMHIVEPVVNFLRSLPKRTEELARKHKEVPTDKLKIEEVDNGNTNT